MNYRSLIRLYLVLLAAPCPVWAQGLPSENAGTPRKNDFTVSIEPVSGGVQYLHALGNHLYLGTVATVGPQYGVTLNGHGSGELRVWATAYPVLSYRSQSGVEASLSPVGVAVAGGNDFGVLYPSAQAGLALVRQRWRVGSAVRVVRIAGGNGSGIYWTQWVPVTLGVTFRW